MSQEKAISIFASKLSFHMYTHTHTHIYIYIERERESYTLCNFVRITHFSHYFVINLTVETL